MDRTMCAVVSSFVFRTANILSLENEFFMTKTYSNYDYMMLLPCHNHSNMHI